MQILFKVLITALQWYVDKQRGGNAKNGCEATFRLSVMDRLVHRT